ncbi:Rieske (2Fe-2S) protein [Streptomyces lancefieldiae]|uniref:Cytochrome bc1 complex Rieske iron-sulfur subunit n=1 Tax=Streptomyces lancefieldiae TaxID=3075520 RepID=A0ABU3AMF6_9ACTN|nr:Rieske (2Fe-2S) protein [Streptomyces sp. DSM 40712]MDT0610742.1 Rieske (2Fe-2S) protein [Streptomyces sp. DSM 40712]
MPGRPVPSRRTVLRSAALTPVAGIGLAACSPGDDGAVPARPTAPVDLGKDGEVAKGATKLYRDQNVVVSRAEDGSLKAFSTVCTHAGCPIKKLEGTKLVCPCHGSEFDARTGEVLHAPADAPLIQLPVEVKQGRIVASPGT